MAVFCERTGVKLLAPTGDEAADCAAWDRAISRGPVSVDVHPRGWKLAPPPPPPAPVKSEPDLAPDEERGFKPAASAASYAPRKGGK